MGTQLKTVVGVLKQTAVDWLDDKAPRLGAALAYYAIFSIAPLVVIVIAIAGLWFGKDLAQQQILHQFSGMVAFQGLATRREKQGDHTVLRNRADWPVGGIPNSAWALPGLRFACMSTETLLIIVVLVLLLGGGGFFWSRRGR